MVESCHLVKSKNRHMSAMLRLISTKCGMMALGRVLAIPLVKKMKNHDISTMSTDPFKI